jgi:micrococcal nuclease
MKAYTFVSVLPLLIPCTLSACVSPPPVMTPAHASATELPPTPPTARDPLLAPTSASGLVEARVLQVIDGDTIEVDIDGGTYAVRYIGIDLPEPEQPGGPIATLANRQLVEGQTVRLEKDVSETDRYGRLLRYVYVGELFVNAELVRMGYARVTTYPPDVRYSQLFTQLEQQAREEGRGFWMTYADSEQLASVNLLVDPSCCQFDAPGNDNDNKEEEYVCLRNEGDEAVDMTGWSLRDRYGWTYVFPPFVLEPSATVRVHTGCGTMTSTDLYWCKDDTAVWNNDGDTVHLLDADRNLILRREY